MWQLEGKVLISRVDVEGIVLLSKVDEGSFMKCTVEDFEVH